MTALRIQRRAGHAGGVQLDQRDHRAAKEYVGHTRRNPAIPIGGTNSLWLFAPARGMVASIMLIDTDSYGFPR